MLQFAFVRKLNTNYCPQVDRRCIVAATLKASGALHSRPAARLS